MLRLLCVTAHPDDESGGFGGTLLQAHERGIETHVLCLTPGQAASHRGDAGSERELIERRKGEFAAACAILKVTRGEVLDYPDGGLDRTDFHAVTGEIVRRVRRIRPQVMLCFGPEGAITGHPDHTMSGLLATAAFQWAARDDRYPEQLSDGLRPHRPQKLYWGTNLFTLPDRPPIAPPPATAVIDISPYFESKVAAFHAHTSQAPLFPIFDRIVGQRGPEETFHLAASITLHTIERETDLFSGVRDEGEAPRSG